MKFITLLLFGGILMTLGFKPTNPTQYFILSTSKFWYNIRQGVNVMMIYRFLKDNGVADENIVLLIPENLACNSKNNYPGILCPFDELTYPNLYRNVEVDYKQNDVSIKNWENIWRGKYQKYTPQSRRLSLSKDRTFLSYSSGHGGDGYIKMQDTAYLLDFEMAKIMREMHHLEIFKESLLFADSCGAVTLYEKIDTPNTLILGSSSWGEKSYSNGKDKNLLLPKSDKFSFATFNYLNNHVKHTEKTSFSEYFRIFDFESMGCTAKLINTFPKNETDIYLQDYFIKKKENSYQFTANHAAQLNENGNTKTMVLGVMARFKKGARAVLSLTREPLTVVKQGTKVKF